MVSPLKQPARHPKLPGGTIPESGVATTFEMCAPNAGRAIASVAKKALSGGGGTFESMNCKQN